jgi:hypothetical protein
MYWTGQDGGGDGGGGLYVGGSLDAGLGINGWIVEERVQSISSLGFREGGFSLALRCLGGGFSCGLLLSPTSLFFLKALPLTKNDILIMLQFMI